MEQKINLKRIIIFIAIFVIGVICNTISYAGISISTTSVSMREGETKNVNLVGNDVTGTVSVTSSNNNVATVSAGNWIENSTVTISITAKSAGTSTITVSGVVTNSATRWRRYKLF